MIEGVFLGTQCRGGEVFLIYAYRCSVCSQQFKETVSEVSEPALCHRCYTRCPAEEQLPLEIDLEEFLR